MNGHTPTVIQAVVAVVAMSLALIGALNGVLNEGALEGILFTTIGYVLGAYRPYRARHLDQNHVGGY